MRLANACTPSGAMYRRTEEDLQRVRVSVELGTRVVVEAVAPFHRGAAQGAALVGLLGDVAVAGGEAVAVAGGRAGGPLAPVAHFALRKASGRSYR